MTSGWNKYWKVLKYNIVEQKTTVKREIKRLSPIMFAEAISGTKITGPTATLIAGNSTANLSCQAAAGTVMTRTWQKDGKPLSASSRLLFAADMSSMMINLLQKEDNGEYKCVFANPISSDEASYKMMVNCECLFLLRDLNMWG